MEPKEDEYWYIKYGYGIELGKLKFIHNNDYYVKFYWGRVAVTKDRFVRKWKPNLFWKMLGYKY